MNWANPLITTQYDIFLAEVKSRDVDSFTMGVGGPPSLANQPVGAMIFDRVNGRFLEWNGTDWATRLIGMAGGGTGATDANGIRSQLGLGTMSTQNSDAVVINGGSIWGITLLDLNCSIHFINPNDIGSSTGPVRNLYVGNGLVVPVGVNKYAP